MGKYTLIVVAGLAFAFGIVRGNLNRASEDFSRQLTDSYQRSAARQAANTLAHLTLATLNDSIFWRAGYSGVATGEAAGWAGIADNGTDTTLVPGRVRITASGTAGSAIDTVVVVAAVPFFPADVAGAITANSDVTTLGSLVVDARDHDLSGNLIANQGTKAVSTTQIYNQNGGSKAGGTGDDGTDHAPAKPAHPDVVWENMPGPFPANPDAVLGYAPGTLKAIAQSGANGGQYVTDPGLLTFPLSGVTYVELPAASTWQDIDFGTSEGVLVVHNQWTDAKIKNLNNGTFTGLIIADDIEKIHTTILGAVVSMTTSPAGNCIGNGTGDVLFSRQAVHRATSMAGGGDGDVAVLSWYE